MTRRVEWYGEAECPGCHSTLSCSIDLSGEDRIGDVVETTVTCGCVLSFYRKIPITLTKRHTRCECCGQELPEGK